MNKLNNKFLDIFLRYLILVLVAIPNLFIFYFVFTPLTIYLSYSFLSVFFDTSLQGTLIYVGCASINIVNSCVAGSAYFLLLILNLSISHIKLSKRLKMIFFAFGIFLLINVLRIFILSIILVNDFVLFESLHKFTWYFLSIIFVLFIWFLEVKLFKIKSTPFYSDIKFLFKQIK